MSWQFQTAARRRLSREHGTIFKNWGGRLPIALVYPNSYRVGMSNLGFHTVYSLFNQDDGVVCERAFWDDRAKDLSDRTPLSLESQRALSEFAVIAFSTTFELDYLNIVSALKASNVPALTAERDERHPLVIGGGPCLTGNPEPVAPFFDALAMGEAEAILPRLIDVLKSGPDIERPDLLRRLAEIPGIYVPSLYEVRYKANGAVEAIVPGAGSPGGAFPVVRQTVRDLDQHPVHSVVLTPDTELGDMYLIEVSRGCARACRFCLAGFIFLPIRRRSMDSVENIAQEGLRYRQRIGLVGAATSDYPAIGQLALRLRHIGAKVAVSSLRMDSVSDDLLRALAESGIQTVTFAPEAGSERLRSLINKRLSSEQILQATEMAARWKFRNLKLYYMIGLPTETDEDAKAIVDLTLELKSVLERRQRRCQVTLNLSPFVPKAQTPFQDYAMAEVQDVERRIRLIQDGLRRERVAVRHESAAWSEVQGVLAIGDRRLADVLAEVPRLSIREWKHAMEKFGLEPDFYLRRSRGEGEIPPWSAVRAGIVLRRSEGEEAKPRTAKLLSV